MAPTPSTIGHRYLEYKISFFGILLSFICIFTLPSIARIYSQTRTFSTIQSPKKLSIRSAKATDLDALTWIGLAAFPFEPQWLYRYPYATEFPDDHTKFTRLRYGEWLREASTPDCTIMVAESPSLEGASITKVFGFSIWRMPSDGLNNEPNDKLKPPKAQHLRRDANPFHMAAYRTSVTLAQERYFDRFYGRKQLSLAQLATHPDYFGHGAAAMSLEWGLALGEKEKWPITLFAGPKAYSLYSRFGFKTIVVVTTKVVDEDMELKYPGLAWEPTGYLGQAEERNPVERLRELVVVYDVNRDTQSN